MSMNNEREIELSSSTIWATHPLFLFILISEDLKMRYLSVMETKLFS